MASSTQPQPLTTADIRQLQTLLKGARETLDLCKKIQGCNIDVSKEAVLTEEQIGVLERMLLAFGPPQK